MFFYGCHSIHTGVYLEVRFKEDIKKPDDIASNAIDISIIIYRDGQRGLLQTLYNKAVTFLERQKVFVFFN